MNMLDDQSKGDAAIRVWGWGIRWHVSPGEAFGFSETKQGKIRGQKEVLIGVISAGLECPPQEALLKRT